jgi:hypothetical protein
LVKHRSLRAELLVARGMRGKQLGDLGGNLIGGRGQDARRRGSRRDVGRTYDGTNIRQIPCSIGN